MRIAVEGCCHGELDKIYQTVTELEKQNGFKIDLLIICGDFQAVRNFDDLQAMAVPAKYQQLNTFYKYYSREKVAPVLTVFIGGNHEASNYMQELPYGGWVAPNIYYMGYAGIIQVGGLRIGGISGIFKGHDFNRGHHERPPYQNDTVRSVYHIRNLEVFRLKQISRPVDIFLSHDWPKGVYHHGDVATLVRRKPFFKQEIEEDKLGSRPLSELLTHLQPAYWFAAHLHVKFAAHVEHQAKSGDQPSTSTKFLALDKCLPRRQFLQVLELPHDEKEGLKIKLDAEWMCVLHSTNHLLRLSPGNSFMPGPGCGQRHDFQVTDKEMEQMAERFGGDLTLPENFVHTAPPIIGNPKTQPRQGRRPLIVQVNPQTTLLCTMLEITDPNAKFLGKTSQELLDESGIGVPEGGTGDMEDDSGDDVEDDDDDDEMPSSIDSSMDTSSRSMDTSKWESFQTANETFSSSGVGTPNMSPSVPSTPAKSSSQNVSTADIQVNDDDEELLLILAAQKNKSATSDSLLSTCESSLPQSAGQNLVNCDKDSSSNSEQRHGSASDIPKQSCEADSAGDAKLDSNRYGEGREDGHDELDAILSAQKSLQQSNASENSSSGQGRNGCGVNGNSAPINSHSNDALTQKSTGNNDEEDELQAILSAQKTAGKPSELMSSFSSSVDPSSSFSSSVDAHHLPPPAQAPPLKAERTSLGMSGLSLAPAHVPSSNSQEQTLSSLSSTSSSPPGLGQKRDSSESADKFSAEVTPKSGSNVTAGQGSGTKKLKRRNVSVYSEPIE